MLRGSLTRLFHNLPQPTPLIPSSSQWACYSTAPVKNKGKKGRPALTPSQQKTEVMQKLLYPRIIGRSRIAPTGVHRPDVNRALRRVMRSAESHETIERAWQLHRRQLREAREEELRLKYESMQKAMDTLQELDKGLFAQATVEIDPRGLRKDDAEEIKKLKGPAKKLALSRVEGLFPREMRIPTETPRNEGWNYAWKANKVE